MSHYQHKGMFEALTAYNVKRVVVEDGDEFYFIEVEIGGHDESGFYVNVVDGPAAGESVYL